MRIHKQGREKELERREKEEETGHKKQQSQQRRNICKNKRFLKGSTGDGSSAPDCALTQAVREKKGSVIYGESGRFGDGKGLYSSVVVKNLANHTLFFLQR